MKKTVFYLVFGLVFSVFFAVSVYPQNDITYENEPFHVVETQASFPGGFDALKDFIKQNLIYPKEAFDKGIQGRVYVTFVVERDGSLTDVKILRDLGSGCGEAAENLIKIMPLWEPAKQRGKNVRQQFNLPIDFSLDDAVLVENYQPDFSLYDFYNYLQKTVTYPQSAIDSFLEGSVEVSFCINTQGKVRNAQITKSLSYDCDEEVMRAALAYPDYNIVRDSLGNAVQSRRISVHYRFGIDSYPSPSKSPIHYWGNYGYYYTDVYTEDFKGIYNFSFIVEKDGTLSDIVERFDENADNQQSIKEARSIFSQIQKWEPAKYKGKAIRWPCNFRICFNREFNCNIY